jgi:hypothetical protein
MASERVSGYYSRPWLWEKMKANSKVIVQFGTFPFFSSSLLCPALYPDACGAGAGSTDDPFIPASEQRHVAKHIDSHYVEYKDRGHFMTKQFPDLLQFLEQKLPKMLSADNNASSASAATATAPAAPPPTAAATAEAAAAASTASAASTSSPATATPNATAGKL